MSELFIVPEGKKIIGFSCEKVNSEDIEISDIDPRTRTPKRSSRLDDEPIQGFTYKVKWPHHKRSTYMTCNYIIQNGYKIPFELFFNGGDTEIHDTVKAIGRMVSSVFQRGGDIRYIIKDFVKETSPLGAFAKPTGFSKPFMVESFVALIGYNLLDFFYRCDFPGMKELCSELKIVNHSGIGNPFKQEEPEDDVTNEYTKALVANIISGGMDQCPECKEYSMDNSACPVCRSCGHSKCG